MTEPAVALRPASAADRDDAAAFAGRVARWDTTGPVRLRADPAPSEPVVRLWGTTPFDTLVTRSMHGTLEPSDITVRAGNLVAALAVSRQDAVDPGPRIDATWRTQLPPSHGFITVESVPARVIGELADSGVAAARTSPGPAGGASSALLDSVVLTATGAGMSVSVPLRVLFALSGMGFTASDRDEQIRISATDAWLRLDARYGAVVRRRQSLLPLLF